MRKLFALLLVLSLTAVVARAQVVTTAPISFRQTVTTSAVALPSVVFQVGFVMTALAGNTADICIGGAGVTTSGTYCIGPVSGIFSASFAIRNSSVVYIIGSNTSDAVEVVGN